MMAETFDCVTVFYGEIVAFDKLISDCNADEVGGRGFRVVESGSPTHLVFTRGSGNLTTHQPPSSLVVPLIFLPLVFVFVL